MRPGWRFAAGSMQVVARASRRSGAWSIHVILEQKSVRWIVTVATPVNVGIGASAMSLEKKRRSFPILRKDKRSADG